MMKEGVRVEDADDFRNDDDGWFEL